MKQNILVWYSLLTIMFITLPDDEPSRSILLLPEEAEEIFTQRVPYVYFGPEINGLIDHICFLNAFSHTYEYLHKLNTLIQKKHTTAPASLVEAAIVQAAQLLEELKDRLPASKIEQIAHALDDYYVKLQKGVLTLHQQGNNHFVIRLWHHDSK